MASLITAIFTGLLAAIAGVGAWVAFRTLKAVETQARAAEVAAGVAASNAKTTEGALLVTQHAERAYISISHHPPGIVIDDAAITKAGEEHFGGWHDAEVRFGITNHGNTPARILYETVAHIIDEARYNRRNNLPFVTERNYNYDRKREKGEGHDWDEPPQ